MRPNEALEALQSFLSERKSGRGRSRVRVDRHLGADIAAPGGIPVKLYVNRLYEESTPYFFTTERVQGVRYVCVHIRFFAVELLYGKDEAACPTVGERGVW